MHQEPETPFTLSVLTEDETGALVRLAMTLARHRMRVESLTSTSDDSRGIVRHVAVVRATHDRVRRAAKQIGAGVGVLAVDYYAEGETIDREVALFKLEVDGRSGDAFREVARASRARVIVQSGDYVIIEKTGGGREIQELYDALQPFGIMEFVRSGRVVVTKAGPVELTEAETAFGKNAGPDARA